MQIIIIIYLFIDRASTFST